MANAKNLAIARSEHCFIFATHGRVLLAFINLSVNLSKLKEKQHGKYV